MTTYNNRVRYIATTPTDGPPEEKPELLVLGRYLARLEYVLLELDRVESTNHGSMVRKVWDKIQALKRGKKSLQEMDKEVEKILKVDLGKVGWKKAIPPEPYLSPLHNPDAEPSTKPCGQEPLVIAQPFKVRFDQTLHW